MHYIKNGSSACAIFVALECEARFFIDSFKLKKIHQFGPFKLFSNNDQHIVISGIGEKNITMAIALFKGLYPTFNGHLVNLGISGHSHFNIGSIFAINEVLHPEEKQRLFLNPKSENQIPFFSVKTVRKPSLEYLKNYLLEMEAFFFIEAAINFYSIDQLHIIKIVSDNETHNFEKIAKEKVTALFYQNKMLLLNFFKNLTLIEDDSFDLVFENIKRQFNPTESKSHQIKRLLERAYGLNILIEPDSFLNLEQLEQHIKTSIAGAIKL